MSIDVRRNERGAWCVYARGNFISDHATHTAARIAAQQIARAEALTGDLPGMWDRSDLSGGWSDTEDQVR